MIKRLVQLVTFPRYRASSVGAWFVIESRTCFFFWSHAGEYYTSIEAANRRLAELNK